MCFARALLHFESTDRICQSIGMMRREQQIARVQRWLDDNPGESLTSLARHTGLAATTLTRWFNNPTARNQVLKTNTFDKVLAVIEETEPTYLADSVSEQAPLVTTHPTAPVYRIPRPVNSLANPLGAAHGPVRALDPATFRNAQGEHILVQVESQAMDPTIPQGSLVTVELCGDEAPNSGIYLIAFDGTVDLRRLDVDFDQILISADRPGYSEHSIRTVDPARLKIIGQAIWVATGRALI